MSDGARISAETSGTGNGGDVEVRVLDRLSLEGDSIATAASNGNGNAGNLTLSANVLTLDDNARAIVSSLGEFPAGTLSVRADRIELNDNSSLVAETASGSRGSVELTSSQVLLRDASQVRTNATETATGGDIAIETETLALLESSQISANAVRGRGGNISISTTGIFLSPNSSITASSEFGVDGVIAVTEPEIDTNAGLVELSSAPIDPATQVTSACDAARENSFVVTGNGGLPPDPTEMLHGQTVWEDMRSGELPSSNASSRDAIAPDGTSESSRASLREATTWQRRSDGTVVLLDRRLASGRMLPWQCYPHPD
ncbi:S-layer family protein [Baaleninema simplex]|uniref:S-layer family protein n=1 Tax=Baaleninema simplex TaxID=2862350 RepID=UPI00034DD277|nr:S-layer family protein [Baaleninema simplex]